MLQSNQPYEHVDKKRMSDGEIVALTAAMVAAGTASAGGYSYYNTHSAQNGKSLFGKVGQAINRMR